MKEFRDILRFLEERPGQPLALATLVSAHGSSFRRPGARMLIGPDGASAGGVSAGCIEDEVATRALEVLRTGTPALMNFDTRLRFGCHGDIRIFIERLGAALLLELRARLQRRERCQLQTQVEGEARGTSLVDGEPVPGVFVQTVEPLLRLLLLGDSSDTAALRAQAALQGWDVLSLKDAPGPELLDERTAVVIATHNFGRDGALLRELLPAGLKYLGLVGSRRRRDDLLFDVLQDGVAAESNLFAPAGLHLGADAPEEIALSIVAEIQSVFASGSTQSLRVCKTPIHQPALQLLPCAASAA